MDTAKVSASLVKAQRAFSPALKTSTNPHFKSRYADLAACVEAVIDALNANGIALVQKQHPTDGGVAVETIFVHESGEQLSAGVLSVPAAKQDPQGYGSALTYARRYSLMAACGIAPEDDDGNAASKAQKQKGGVVAQVLETSPEIPKAEREYLDGLADTLMQLAASGRPISEIVDKIDEAQLDNDHKIYLWSLLPSSLRSSIKAAARAHA